MIENDYLKIVIVLLDNQPRKGKVAPAFNLYRGLRL